MVVGLIVSRNDKEIVMRDAQAKEHRFAAADVETVTPQKQSLDAGAIAARSDRSAGGRFG